MATTKARLLMICLMINTVQTRPQPKDATEFARTLMRTMLFRFPAVYSQEVDMVLCDVYSSVRCEMTTQLFYPVCW